MTATLVPAVSSADPRTTSRSLVRAGVVAGLVAASATTAVAAIAHAAGVSLEASAEQIPVLGFGQLTLFFTAIGVLLAAVLRRRARTPQATFLKVTVVLTALSLVPDLVLSADVATKATLMATHLVASAIVIPAVAFRLPERSAR
jgi:peptidoglycan/LPS O-acetylase OafA/YrhL